MVAICIPTYEHPDLLRRLLNSIRIQNYLDYKVYISDDSKTNCIEELICGYTDLKIQYIHNETALGTSNNVNKSIKMANDDNNDIIKIMFQDDWFVDESALKKMVLFMTESGADVIFTANYEGYKNGMTLHICDNVTIQKIKNDNSYLFRGNYLGAPSVLVYKASSHQFDPEFTWLLDVDFYLNLLPGKRMEYLNEPLVVIGHDGDQLTDYYDAHPMKKLDETRRQLKKYQWLQTKDNKKFFFRYCIINVKNLFKEYIRKLGKILL